MDRREKRFLNLVLDGSHFISDNRTFRTDRKELLAKKEKRRIAKIKRAKRCAERSLNPRFFPVNPV